MTYDQNRLRPRDERERPAGKSPQRVIQRPRIPEDTWLLSLERCQAENTPIGHVLTELLEAWLAREIEL